MEVEEIYAEIILDRYKNPRNKGKLESFNFKEKEFNEVCGDWVEISLKVENNKIKDVKFQGEGCAISQASCDLLLDYIKNKEIKQVKEIDENFLINNILKIQISYRRFLCATYNFIISYIIFSINNSPQHFCSNILG